MNEISVITNLKNRYKGTYIHLCHVDINTNCIDNIIHIFKELLNVIKYLHRESSLIVITYNMQIISCDEHYYGLNSSILTNIGKTALNENLIKSFKIIDLDRNDLNSKYSDIYRDEIFTLKPGYSQIGYRDGQRFFKQYNLINIKYRKKKLKFTGTFLITGGSQGLGLETAKWLIAKGVNNIVIISRNAKKHLKYEDLVPVCNNSIIDARIYNIDVSDYTELKNLLTKISRDMPPIRGIFHSAMVLKDSYIKDIDADDIKKIMYPKILGAINLNKLTQSLDLDYFVMFSSISSIIGNPGQAVYSSSNLFLDSLAIHRMNQGLKGISINFGLLKDVGLAKDNDKLKDYLNKYGITPISKKDALEGIRKAILLNRPNFNCFKINWDIWYKNFPNSMLNEGGASGNTRIIHSKRGGDTVINIENILTELLAAFLNSNTVDATFEFDSLSMVEIIIMLNNRFDVQLSGVDLVKCKSPHEVAKLIHREIN